MRSIASALLVALLLPAAIASTLGAGRACCCKKTCAMKRVCSTSTRVSCGSARPETAATPLPNLGVQGPATLTSAVAEVAIHLPVASLDRSTFLFASCARHAPNAPPPKLA